MMCRAVLRLAASAECMQQGTFEKADGLYGSRLLAGACRTLPLHITSRPYDWRCRGAGWLTHCSCHWDLLRLVMHIALLLLAAVVLKSA